MEWVKNLCEGGTVIVECPYQRKEEEVKQKATTRKDLDSGTVTLIRIHLNILALCLHEHTYLVWCESDWNGLKKRQIFTRAKTAWLGNYIIKYSAKSLHAMLKWTRSCVVISLCG